MRTVTHVPCNGRRQKKEKRKKRKRKKKEKAGKRKKKKKKMREEAKRENGKGALGKGGNEATDITGVDCWLNDLGFALQFSGLNIDQ
jgi:hypothetical protein